MPTASTLSIAYQILNDERNDLLAVLKEIAKGEGEFDRDPLKHAENCIEHMKAVADAAIALVEEGK